MSQPSQSQSQQSRPQRPPQRRAQPAAAASFSTQSSGDVRMADANANPRKRHNDQAGDERPVKREHNSAQQGGQGQQQGQGQGGQQQQQGGNGGGRRRGGRGGRGGEGGQRPQTAGPRPQQQQGGQARQSQPQRPQQASSPDMDVEMSPASSSSPPLSSPPPRRGGTGNVDASFKTATTFASAGLSEPTARALREEFGYETMSIVQEATIPTALRGEDIVAKAKTGTGQTSKQTLTPSE